MIIRCQMLCFALLGLSCLLIACSDDPEGPGPKDDIQTDAPADASGDVDPADVSDDVAPPDADGSDTSDVGPVDVSKDVAEDIQIDVPLPDIEEDADVGPCGSAEDCPGFGELGCTVPICIEGECKYVKADEGTECDDADLCTTDEACDLFGQCVGKQVSCDDGNQCTSDICQVENGACANLPTPKAECDDGDLCTESDQCSDSAECSGVPKDCDDGEGCTLDSCVAGVCETSPNPACVAVLEESFDCDGPAGGWDFTVLEGVVTWAIDGEPDPPAAYSPACSLNFNDNGNDYDSPGGQASFGQATSPVVDATSLPQGSPLYVSFYNYWDTEDGPQSNWDKRGIEISTDGFESSEGFDVGHVDGNDNQWFPTVIDLSGYSGSKFRIRFYFDTVDSIANDGVGWFVDDLVVAPSPPVLPAEECGDGEDNDFDLAIDCDDSDCAFDEACIKPGDTCANALPLNSANLPVVANGDTSDFGAHYGYPEGACPGESGGWGGGVMKGAPDVVYAFTPTQTDDYLITLAGPGFDTNLYIVTDCEDIGSSCVAGSDNALEGETEKIIVGLSAGTTYFIVVDGWSPTDPDNAGPFELVIDLAPEFDCNDGVDNDENGLTDCADPACADVPVCSPESNCFDGKDNDEDGQTDCADPDCVEACVETGNCTDGIDNDSNGVTDCDDDECVNTGACKVEKCNDGIDNDEDGLTDCDDDECFGKGNCSNVGETCKNPIVVNANALPYAVQGDTSLYSPDYGYVPGACPGEEGGWGGGKNQGSPDMVFEFTPNKDGHYLISVAPEYDANLYVVSDCGDVDSTCLGASEVPGLTVESVALTFTGGQTVFIVVDGWQNNAQNVAGEFGLTVSLAPESDCGDGQDNDQNGATDCLDAGCVLSHKCVPEGDCTNGIDDDGDGLVDCADSECIAACDESSACDDGVDNDKDGATDCADTDCKGTPACFPEICDDGEDNDEDKLVDCADPECSEDLYCIEFGNICAKPYAIGSLPFSHNADSCTASDDVQTQAGGGCFIGGQGFSDRIYSYTPAANGTFTFSVAAGPDDPSLLLNVATECGALVNECAGGDDPFGGDPTVVVDLLGGQTYYVIVDGFSAFFPPTCGGYTLSVDGVFTETGNCTDGIDNDEDGDTDCDDAECANEPVCGCASDADCASVDACVVGVCTAATGQCTFNPVDCNDGEICTSDTCDKVEGCQNNALVCDDGVGCTVDFCTPGQGCGSAMNHAACDDGSVCTVGVCDDVDDCIFIPVNCDDGVSCTVENCDAQTGCASVPSDDLCDDGDSCTSDTCLSEGGCLSEVIPGCEGGSCDDAIPVGALPFSHSGDTSKYGDSKSYGSDACVIDTDTSLALDGLGTHVTFDQGSAFDYSETEGMSFGFWMKLPIGFANPGMIVVQGPASWYMTVNGFQALSWRPVAPTTATTGNGVLIEGVWSHILATYDNKTYEARIYVDGVELASTVGEGPLNYAAGLQPHLGRNWSNVNPLVLKATIDEVVVFDHALDADAVMGLYIGADMAPMSLTPDHWWRMGEGDTFPTIVDHGVENSPGTVEQGSADSFVVDATDQPGGGAGASDVVYTYTAASDGLHRAEVDAEYAATVYVVSDCTNVSQSCLGMDYSVEPGVSELTWDATDGTTYTIIVDGTSGDQGPYVLTIEAL